MPPEEVANDTEFVFKNGTTTRFVERANTKLIYQSGNEISSQTGENTVHLQAVDFLNFIGIWPADSDQRKVLNAQEHGRILQIMQLLQLIQDSIPVQLQA